MKMSELFEIHATPEKSELSKLRSVITKALNMKKSEAWDFSAAANNQHELLGWSSSSGKRVRLDLSNIDEELKSLIMRFILTWFKKIHEMDHPTKADLAYELSYLKDFVRDLKYCKFPMHEIDTLNLFKQKSPVENKTQ